MAASATAAANPPTAEPRPAPRRHAVTQHYSAVAVVTLELRPRADPGPHPREHLIRAEDRRGGEEERSGENGDTITGSGVLRVDEGGGRGVWGEGVAAIVPASSHGTKEPCVISLLKSYGFLPLAPSGNAQDPPTTTTSSLPKRSHTAIVKSQAQRHVRRPRPCGGWLGTLLRALATCPGPRGTPEGIAGDAALLQGYPGDEKGER